MPIPIIPFSPTPAPKHRNFRTTWQRDAEKNNERVRGRPADRCDHQVQPRSMMLKDDVHTGPKGIPRPVQRGIKKENGQAVGVSTRPLVGNLLTLLDLSEKFLTKHTCKPKKILPSPKTFAIFDTSHQIRTKRPTALTGVPKVICTKWNSSKTNGQEQLIGNASQHEKQSQRENTKGGCMSGHPFQKIPIQRQCLPQVQKHSRVPE